MKSKMTLKQFLAWVAILFILALYAAAFFLSFCQHKTAQLMFWAAIISTIAIPVLIHLFLMMKNVRNGKSIWGDPYKKKGPD